MIEQTLILIKPDAINRGLLGEIVHRFERKGLKIVAMKIMHLKDKPFFPGVKKFMQASPTVIMVVEGFEAVEIARLMCGPTKASQAPAGTIRGDYALSVQSNVVHASDSKETARQEIKRFFKKEEVLEYDKIDFELLLAPDEKRKR